MDEETRIALDAGPWNELEIRYIRKAVRHHLYDKTVELGNRKTPPSGRNTSALPVERREQLETLAAWVVQKPC